MLSHNDKIEIAKTVADGLSVATVLGAIAEILPPVASLFTIIWLGIRIFESKTVQDLLKRNKPDA